MISILFYVSHFLFYCKKKKKATLLNQNTFFCFTAASGDNVTGLCLSDKTVSTTSSNHSCSLNENPAQHVVYPVLLLGQLLLGIGAVPIQPFGISYIDDYASKKNSPLYLGTAIRDTSHQVFSSLCSSLCLVCSSFQSDCTTYLLS